MNRAWAMVCYGWRTDAGLRRALRRRGYELGVYPFSDEVCLMAVRADGSPRTGELGAVVGSAHEPERAVLLRVLSSGVARVGGAR